MPVGSSLSTSHFIIGTLERIADGGNNPLANKLSCLARGQTDSIHHQVDYTKLAAELNMSNVRSASNAWAAIKKKIMAKAGIEKAVNGEEGGGSEKPKATPKKRAKKAASEGVDGDDEEGGSPKKKARTPKKKAKSEEKVQEDGEDEGSPVKKEVDEED